MVVTEMIAGGGGGEGQTECLVQRRVEDVSCCHSLVTLRWTGTNLKLSSRPEYKQIIFSAYNCNDQPARPQNFFIFPPALAVVSPLCGFSQIFSVFWIL